VLTKGNHGELSLDENSNFMWNTGRFGAQYGSLFPK